MGERRVFGEAGFHPGCAEPLGIGHPFVPQRVVSGHDDVGGRQASQFGAERGRERQIAAFGVRQVVVPEPPHLRDADGEGGGVGLVGGAGEVVVGHRIKEHLEVEAGPVFVAGTQGAGRGEVAARTVPAHSQRAVRGDGGGNMLHRGVGVVHGRGEGVFGGEPVVDAHHGPGEPVGEEAAQFVAVVEVAGDPAAAVQVDEGGSRCGVGGVDARADLSVGDGEADVAYRPQVGAVGARAVACGDSGARLFRGEGGEGRGRGRGCGHGSDCGIHWGGH